MKEGMRTSVEAILLVRLINFFGSQILLKEIFVLLYQSLLSSFFHCLVVVYRYCLLPVEIF